MRVVDDIDWRKPIWQREEPVRYWDPARRLIKTIRRHQKLKASKNPFHQIMTKLTVLEHRFWSVITGAEIDLSCQIGGGFLLPHPNGVVIHPGSVIGPNCMFFQQVTLAGPIHVGYHVDIGAGAKIIGPLTIGNHASVGANAVVKKDVAESDIVAGIPAYSIKKHKKTPQRKKVNQLTMQHQSSADFKQTNVLSM